MCARTPTKHRVSVSSEAGLSFPHAKLGDFDEANPYKQLLDVIPMQDRPSHGLNGHPNPSQDASAMPLPRLGCGGPSRVFAHAVPHESKTSEENISHVPAITGEECAPMPVPCPARSINDSNATCPPQLPSPLANQKIICTDLSSPSHDRFGQRH